MVGTARWIAALLLALGSSMARGDAPPASDLIGCGRIRMAVGQVSDGQGAVALQPQDGEGVARRLRYA